MNNFLLAALCLSLVLPSAKPLAAAEAEPIQVKMQIDASRPLGELREIWRFFGADEPNFRMFSKMSGQCLAVQSDGAVALHQMLKSGVRGKPDVSGFASTDGHSVCAMLWHHHDDDLPGLKEGPAVLHHYRIDETHSNAFSAWQRMGSPRQPTPQQDARLVEAGQLETLLPPEKLLLENETYTLPIITLPRQSVSLIVLEMQP